MDRTYGLVIPGNSDDYVNPQQLEAFRYHITPSMVVEMALLSLPYQYEPEALYGVLAEYMESEVLVTSEIGQEASMAQDFDDFYAVVSETQQRLKPSLLGWDDQLLSTLSYVNMQCELQQPDRSTILEIRCES